MKKFCIDQDGRVEVYSEAKFRDILGETWGKVEEQQYISEDGDECHEEYVKFGHTVGAWHEGTALALPLVTVAVPVEY